MGRRGLGLYMGMESILYLFLVGSCPWTVWYVLAESVVYGINHAILRQANHFRNGTFHTVSLHKDIRRNSPTKTREGKIPQTIHVTLHQSTIYTRSLPSSSLSNLPSHYIYIFIYSPPVLLLWYLSSSHDCLDKLYYNTALLFPWCQTHLNLSYSRPQKTDSVLRYTPLSHPHDPPFRPTTGKSGELSIYLRG